MMLPDRRSAMSWIDRTIRSKPLVFVVAAWVVGIRLADCWALSPELCGATGLALALGSLRVRYRWLALILLLLGVTGLGLSAMRRATTAPRGDIAEWIGRQVAVEGTVAEEPERGCANWRFLLSSQSVL